jgi:hypothetical protein
VSAKRPPLGVRLSVDVELYAGARLTVWCAPVRWYAPATGKREAERPHEYP